MSETIQAYVVALETLLGREWRFDDCIRTTRLLVREVSDNLVSLEDEIQNEVVYPVGRGGETRQQLPDILVNYYRLILQAWPVLTEGHPRRDSLPTDLNMDDDLDLDLSEGDDDDDIFLVLDRDQPSAGGGRRLSAEAVLDQLKTRTAVRVGDDGDDDICSICLDDLRVGFLAKLDCRHEFHVDCIKRWLVRRKNCCPLCKARALRHDMY